MLSVTPVVIAAAVQTRHFLLLPTDPALLEQFALLMQMIVVSRELGVEHFGTPIGCFGTLGQASAEYIFAMADEQLAHTSDW